MCFASPGPSDTVLGQKNPIFGHILETFSQPSCPSHKETQHLKQSDVPTLTCLHANGVHVVLFCWWHFVIFVCTLPHVSNRIHHGPVNASVPPCCFVPTCRRTTSEISLNKRRKLIKQASLQMGFGPELCPTS